MLEYLIGRIFFKNNIRKFGYYLIKRRHGDKANVKFKYRYIIGGSAIISS